MTGERRRRVAARSQFPARLTICTPFDSDAALILVLGYAHLTSR